MANLTLTPLDTIPEFDEPLRKKLAAKFWITSAEEFHGVLRSSNQQYKSGRKALALALGLADTEMEVLASAVRAALPEDTPFDSSVEMEVGTGMLLEGIPELEESSFAAVVELPDLVEPLTKAKNTPAPQSQGNRNTCVAFTLAAAVQILSGDPTDLSEQFLYYLCKEKDGVPGDVGTRPDLAVQLLQEVGICTEATWPYQAEPNHSQPGGPTPPTPAYNEAKRRRITGFTQLPAKGNSGLTQIQAQLAAGKPVLIGMPIYEHWNGSTQGKLLGRVRAALPGERQLGGHAMCVVGYRSDPTAPGGGYFIVRNRWGTEWGKDNSDGAGYCHMPYELVMRQNVAAFAIDGVVVETVAIPAKKVGSRGSFSSPARLGSSAGGSDNLMAIYTDLLSVKEQVDGLTQRLQSILGVSVPVVDTIDAPEESTIADPAPAPIITPVPIALP
ncbi:MAG: C1 family peptidase, partial [Oscillochloris sp.]|nr:C1 family peptidase [Oscillochloris sp.]